jgi:hypothetical protein
MMGIDWDGKATLPKNIPTDVHMLIKTKPKNIPTYVVI